LRTTPVRREEVRIHGFNIGTLPCDACDWRSGFKAIGSLFEPLVEELAAADMS
jgi:hypothetical protein